MSLDYWQDEECKADTARIREVIAHAESSSSREEIDLSISQIVAMVNARNEAFTQRIQDVQ